MALACVEKGTISSVFWIVKGSDQAMQPPPTPTPHTIKQLLYYIDNRWKLKLNEPSIKLHDIFLATAKKKQLAQE